MKRFFITLALCATSAVMAEEVKPVQPPTAPPAAPPLTPPPAVNVPPATPTQPAPSTPKLPPVGVVIPPRSTAPLINLPKPPNQEWIAQLDRLRIQPRPGEVNNGTVQANITDIFSDNPDLRAKAAALSAEYEKALLEKSAKWESELKEFRAQYESQLMAELPEAKRADAQKFLDASRLAWTEASARDAKMRSAFLERMRSGARIQPSAPGTTAQSANDPNVWMREERMKAMKQDDESVKSLRALLGAEEVARFDRYNRARPMPYTGPATRSANAPPLGGVPRSPLAPVAPSTIPVAPVGAPNLPTATSSAAPPVSSTPKTDAQIDNAKTK